MRRTGTGLSREERVRGLQPRERLSGRKQAGMAGEVGEPRGIVAQKLRGELSGRSGLQCQRLQRP